MSEPSQIETLERQIENWSTRTRVAESECHRLLNDNTELWKLIKNLAEVNKILVGKLGYES